MDYPWSHVLPWLLHQLIILTPMAHSWTILGHPSDGPGPIMGQSWAIQSWLLSLLHLFCLHVVCCSWACFGFIY